MKKSEEILKKEQKTRLIIMIVLAVAVIGLVVGVIADAAAHKTVTMNTDFSASLDENGRVVGIDASEYVEIPEYNDLTIDLSEIDYTDEDVDYDIEALLEDYMYVDEAYAFPVAEGDLVSINYSGTVDGAEFEGGSEEDCELELGAGELDFEEIETAVIGHSVGDVIVVQAVIPEDYEWDESVCGKTAVFTVSLNGVYAVPEFTDEFVADNLSEYASTAEEYRQYLKSTNLADNLYEYVQEYLTYESVLKSSPGDYRNQLKANMKADEFASYEYLNEMYNQFYGYTLYSSFTEYLDEEYGMTELEFDDSLEEDVDESLAYILTCQAIADKEGITATADEVLQHYLSEGETEDDFNAMIESYGTGYVVQQYLQEKVVDYVIDRTNLNINES